VNYSEPPDITALSDNFSGMDLQDFGPVRSIFLQILSPFSGPSEPDSRAGGGMKPRERRETGQSDLFKARLDQVIDMSHPRVRLAQRIDWRCLEQKFGAVYTDGAGRPPLPTRLMAGLCILKYSENLSDERLCEVWAENPYFQYFCGEECVSAPFNAP
jgi:hypothetical protein